MQHSDNTNIIFQANFATKLLESLLHLAEVQTVSTGFNLFPSEIHVCLSEAKFFSAVHVYGKIKFTESLAVADKQHVWFRTPSIF